MKPNRRPNTTQRSWDNYVGDNPNFERPNTTQRSWDNYVGDNPNFERPNTTQRSWSNYVGDATPSEERREKRRQDSALKKGMRNMGEMKPMGSGFQAV